jgi:hypothetical protein
MKLYFDTTEGRIFNFLTSWWVLTPVLLLLLAMLCFLVAVVVLYTKNIQEHKLREPQEQRQQQQSYLPGMISAKVYVALETWRVCRVPLFVLADNHLVCAKDCRQREGLLNRHVNFFSYRSYLNQKLNHPFLFLHNA